MYSSYKTIHQQFNNILQVNKNTFIMFKAMGFKMIEKWIYDVYYTYQIII